MGSSNSAYQGEGLDSHLKILGQFRLPGESDLDFRKRVFPEVFQRDRRWAFEILVGKEPHRWGPKLEGLLHQLGKSPTLEELAYFARRWGEASHV